MNPDVCNYYPDRRVQSPIGARQRSVLLLSLSSSSRCCAQFLPLRVCVRFAAEMACIADVSRAAAACASAPCVSCSTGGGNAGPRVSVSVSSPFFSQRVKSLSASVYQVRSAQVKNAAAPLIVNMAKREEELVEVRKMSDEDINTTVVDLKGELFLLRSKQATRQEYKSSEFRRIRKNIARMLTVRRERELERGISLRESRKLDREWKRNIVIKPPPSYAVSLAEQAKK